jgi:hypothetical protein
LPVSAGSPLPGGGGPGGGDDGVEGAWVVRVSWTSLASAGLGAVGCLPLRSRSLVAVTAPDPPARPAAYPAARATLGGTTAAAAYPAARAIPLPAEGVLRVAGVAGGGTPGAVAADGADPPGRALSAAPAAAWAATPAAALPTTASGAAAVATPALAAR